VVLAHCDILTGMKDRTTLPDDDISRYHILVRKLFYTKPSSGRATVVSDCATSSFCGGTNGAEANGISGAGLGAYVPPHNIEAEQSTLGAMLIDRAERPASWSEGGALVSVAPLNRI